MKFRMQNPRQAGRNSRKRKGLAVVWLNLPGNTLRAAGDLSQLKIPRPLPCSFPNPQFDSRSNTRYARVEG